MLGTLAKLGESRHGRQCPTSSRSEKIEECADSSTPTAESHRQRCAAQQMGNQPPKRMGSTSTACTGESAFGHRQRDAAPKKAWAPGSRRTVAISEWLHSR